MQSPQAQKDRGTTNKPFWFTPNQSNTLPKAFTPTNEQLSNKIQGSLNRTNPESNSQIHRSNPSLKTAFSLNFA
jgi:hypothetical protein